MKPILFLPVLCKYIGSLLYLAGKSLDSPGVQEGEQVQGGAFQTFPEALDVALDVFPPGVFPFVDKWATEALSRKMKKHPYQFKEESLLVSRSICVFLERVSLLPEGNDGRVLPWKRLLPGGVATVQHPRHQDSLPR